MNSEATAVPGCCHFVFADGRACRMLHWDVRSPYCLPHARDERQLLAADRVAAQLASPSGQFKTARDVNHVLGKLFTLRAQNEISCRDAATFAFIGQLLLQSLPALKQEIATHDATHTKPSWGTVYQYVPWSAYDLSQDALNDGGEGDGTEDENS
jgi:hypothetical protein